VRRKRLAGTNAIEQLGGSTATLRYYLTDLVVHLGRREPICSSLPDTLIAATIVVHVIPWEVGALPSNEEASQNFFASTLSFNYSYLLRRRQRHQVPQEFVIDYLSEALPRSR
jgi:hypothetical protein